jgi:hypothetical protein
VWWGGSVQDGVILTDAALDVHQYGGKDIFLGKVRTDGFVDFVRQVGSTRDDELTAMTVDGQGSAVLAGHTYGSMYRVRDSSSDQKSYYSDVFVLTVSLEGLLPSITPQINVGPKYPQEQPSEDADPYDEAFQEEKNKEKRDGTILLVVLVVFLVTVFGCCSCYCYIRCFRGSRGSIVEGAFLAENALLATDRSSSAPVLDQFDNARNVELKRIAEGVWRDSFSVDPAEHVRNQHQPQDDDMFYSSDRGSMDLLLTDSVYRDALMFDSEHDDDDDRKERVDLLGAGKRQDGDFDDEIGDALYERSSFSTYSDVVDACNEESSRSRSARGTMI